MFPENMRPLIGSASEYVVRAHGGGGRVKLISRSFVESQVMIRLALTDTQIRGPNFS